MYGTKKKTSSYNMGGSMPMNNNLGGMVKSQTNNLKKKTA
mgnify:CR=1 FL=1